MNPAPRLLFTIMNRYLDLTGRVALVTGASSGIGAATAVTLADLGARVALSYHRNRQGAEDTRDRIVAARRDRRSPSRPTCAAPDDVRALVERTAAELGPIDILVNNAGSLVARVRHPRDHRGAARRDRRAQLQERGAGLAGGGRLDDRAPARRDRQRRVDRRPQRRRSWRRRSTPRRRPRSPPSPSRSPRSWRRRASASTPCRPASSTRRSTKCSPRRR